jgi:hypothetical protein
MKGADLGAAMLTVLKYGCASHPDLGSLACVIIPPEMQVDSSSAGAH